MNPAPAEIVAMQEPRASWKLARPGFLSNLATVFGGQLACGVVALGVEISYARLLGPTGRGVLSLCMMVVGLGSLISGVGQDVPITIWTADSRKNRADWLPAVSFCALIGCFLATTIWAFAFWLWRPAILRGITPPLAQLVFPTIIALTAINLLWAVFNGLERFRMRARIAFLSQVVELTAVIALVLIFGRNPEFALLGFLVGLVITSVAAAYGLRDFFRVPWQFASFRRRVTESLNLGIRGQMGNLATFFNYRLDVFIVNYFLNPAQVGLYAVGVIVAETLWQVPHAVATALFPRTARTVDEGATEFTVRVLHHVFFMAVLSGIAIALASPIAIPLIFGARFRSSVSVIWWILPGTIAMAVGKVTSADLSGRGKPEYSSVFAMVSLAVTVVLDFLLIPRMGIRGAALASSAAYLADSILMCLALKMALKLSWRRLLVPDRGELGVYWQLWRRSKQFLFSGLSPAA